jgi:membrane protease YdiL (CAAX protease family)
MSGPFSEELGWRGFALDPLLERFGFTKGTTILGLIWGVWHLPLFFMAETWHGRIGFGLGGFWMFMLMSIGLSFIISWVFVNTSRSTLTGMLLHLSSTFSAQLVAGADGMTTPGLEVIKELLIAVVGIGIALYMIVAKKDAASNYSLAAKPQAAIPGGKGAAG